MPHLIHKYIYADKIEEIIRSRVDLCVQCGLCSFICTSKIELREEFAQIVGAIELEKEEDRKHAEVQAKAAAEAEAKALAAQEAADNE